MSSTTQFYGDSSRVFPKGLPYLHFNYGFDPITSCAATCEGHSPSNVDCWEIFFSQWLFLVPVKGGIGSIWGPQKAIYISGI